MSGIHYTGILAYGVLAGKTPGVVCINSMWFHICGHVEASSPLRLSCCGVLLWSRAMAVGETQAT